MASRGIFSPITDIRRKVFTEVARLAYDGDYDRVEELPYKIIPGTRSSYRNSIFLERAIVGERIRLAIGLPLRPLEQHAPIAQGIKESAIAEKYYDPPLVNVIKFACNACPEKSVRVTDMCHGCLEHPCREVCPKKAIHAESSTSTKSEIDQDLCIKCGRCATVCPYHAIIKFERPCASACGMNAISSDENGCETIDYDRCVSCGQCLVSCPFGAIADKGQIFQVVHALKQGGEVYAAVAPAFVGQFGPKVTPEKLRAAFKDLGFTDMMEVAVGADLCTIEEAHDFLDNVPEKLPFLATSCCPAWSVMAKKEFPEYANCISMALTPMVLTARYIKKQHPNCKVVFVGPCAAKKLEASRRTIRSDVDFVLTFEEVMGIFEAKNIDLTAETEDASDEVFSQATAAGRGFPVSGGVAAAVVEAIGRIAPDREVPTRAAQGLRDCRQMMNLAKAGKYNGFLLEGMACPGGCVAGAGTLQAINKSNVQVNMFKNKAERKNAVDSPLSEMADKLD